ncbi:MAG: sigma-70 family RNA polymerase sigma factor [Thermoleophilia bacterium]
MRPRPTDTAATDDGARALLALAQGGDADAFVAFVRLTEAGVVAVLRRLLDDARDVEEAAQDVFVQAWRNLARFRGDSAPFTWLYRIAVNEALQRRRRRRVDTTPLEPGAGRDAITWIAAGGERGPADAVAESRELRSTLGRLLRDLPSDQRAAVVLRDVVGLSNQEVADVLETTLPAAKARIHRGRMALRERLEQHRDNKPSER